MEKQRKIDILRDVIQIESVVGNESLVVSYFEKLLSEAGISIRRINHSEGRDGFIASVKGENPGKVFALSGHSDVVPVGDVEWTRPPFAAEIHDGKMYGRGTSDMKSGLCASVITLIELKESDFKFDGEIRLVVTMGEETSSLGATQMVAMGEADDIDALIIAEPTTGKIDTAHRGALWPRITTIGKTAHGSTPHLGVNAIDSMLLLVARLKEKLDFSALKDDLLGSPSTALTKFQGGKATNVIPDTCVVEFDIRPIPSQDNDEIGQMIQAEIDALTKEVEGFEAKFEFINNLRAIRTDENDPIIKMAKEAGKKAFGKDVETGVFTAYTDASEFVKAKKEFPIIIYGPGLLSMAHQPNEYVEVEEYVAFTDIYKNIIKDFFA